MVANTAITQDTSATSTGVSKDVMNGMKKANMDIEKHLREAHNSLIKAVSTLVRLFEKHNATTTVTTPEPHDNNQNN